MRKAYKYRIYPNAEQKAQLAKIFGCCRFVYNKTLAYRRETFENSKKMLTVKDCIDYYNKDLKTENEWLTQVDEQALINAIYHMDSAYRQFSKGHRGCPKFKSKHDSHKSFTTNTLSGNIVIDFENSTIQLPTLPAMKASLHRELCGQIKSATVSESSGGKYYIAILTDAEHEEIPHTKKSIGLDLKDRYSCITSDGKEYTYTDQTNKSRERLAKLQKELKRKEKGSANYYKCKKKIALYHERITNIEKDTLHKISHEIIRENEVIISENLQDNTRPGAHFALSGELQKQIEYKAKWNHRKHIKINMNSFDNHFTNSQEAAEHVLAVGLNQIG